MKKINIAELLKDCPTGMELDCTMYDNLYFKCIREHVIYPIVCYTVDSKGEKHETSFNWYGKHTPIDTAKCAIFPKGKTTWEGFIPSCLFKDGDVVYVESCYEYIIIYKETPCDNLYKYVAIHNDYLLPDADCPVCNKPDIKEIRLATEEEKEKLFQAIKENGYKWNAETKTLEKFKPKFKVGDKVKRRHTGETHIIDRINSNGYIFKNEGGVGFIFEDDWRYELIPNKFDIATLKPFSEVLVRYDNDNPWMTAHFSHYTAEWEYPYFASGACFRQCIPYKGNERLRGTTNDCEDFYKTWK